MTDWKTIETTLSERFDAKRRSRSGSTRAFTIPATHGHLTVEVTLRPRWCWLAVDRWSTDDRDPDIAKPWFEQHVWPAVQAAMDRRGRRGGGGTLPAGGPIYASASPIDRADLVDVLVPWIEQELNWTTGRHGSRH